MLQNMQDADGRDDSVHPSTPTLSGVELVSAVYSRAATDDEGVLVDLEGSVPSSLRGTYFRNGPGRLEAFGMRYTHPFDGDGFVCRFGFDGKSVSYRGRYVATEEFQKEQEAGRFLYRNFGTQKPGGMLKNLLRFRFKNAANTSVVCREGKLFALWEGGLPHRLCPDSLAVEAREDFGGLLKNKGVERLLAKELPFSAHPRLDPKTSMLYNFGLLLGQKPRLLRYSWKPGEAPKILQPLTLGALSFVHDFVLTERYWVFFLTPVRFRTALALSGLSSPVDAIAAEDGGMTEVLFIPRDADEAADESTLRKRMRRVRLPSSFVFHFVGGFDEGDNVVVDGLTLPHFAGGTIDLLDPEAIRRSGFPPSTLTRYRFNPDKGTLLTEEPWGPVAELPSKHPERETTRYRYSYATARPERPGPEQGGELSGELPVFTDIVKVDHENQGVLRRSLQGALPGEPLFVPKPSAAQEDDGYLLMLRHSPKDTQLHILDARDLQCLYRGRLPSPVPPGFHGTFAFCR